MKLYIGNLPYSFTEEDIKELFSNYASVTSCKLISDRDTGRSKGFGFVELDSDDEGSEAITTLNGKEIDGRSIVVNEARPKTDNRGGGFRKGNSSRGNFRRDRY